jgi:hypothetical protein
MKLIHDMAIFDDNLPMGVKLMGYALGFTLAIAVNIDRVVSAIVLSTARYKSGSQLRTIRLEPKQSNSRK